MISLPTQSQLDPSILDALPEDVRAEVLGFYNSPKRRGGQAILPQSPRKTRTLPPTKAGPSRQPIKRKRGGGLFSRISRTAGSDFSTLTQANFVSRPASKHEDIIDTDPELGKNEELDQDFLAALPDDIRAEVLAQQRQAQLQRKGGIDTSLHRKKKKKAQGDAGPLDRLLHLPPRPARPTFTSNKLSTLPDLREAVSAWYRGFSDEGPYDEDVAALIKYLRDVIVEEADMGKAVAVVKWMGWVVENEGDSSQAGGVKDVWDKVLERIQDGVQVAVKERGLGRVEFG